MRKDMLDALSGLAHQLPNEPDHKKTTLSIMRHIRKVLGAEKVYASLFSNQDKDREATIYHDGPLGDEWGETKLVIGPIKRLAALTDHPLAGDEFFSLLTEEEKRLFSSKSLLFLPVVFNGQALGALWCEGSFDAENAAIEATRQKELLSAMSPLICVAFRNVLFYKTQHTHEETLMRILDNLDANIYVSSLDDDEILFINKKMLQEFGLTASIIGRKCWEGFQEGMTARCPFCPSDTLSLNPNQHVVWEEHNTVTQKYYKNTDSVIDWVNGRLVHLQHSVDITTEKSTMRTLDEAISRAESASKAKGAFLSHMSHEIRTPINAIIGMSRIAKESSDLPQIHECIIKMDSSSKQLLNLINDILDMSKIEANKMELSYTPFNFEKMLMAISNVISVRAEEKRQKLFITMDMDMPRFFKGDEMRISQVITNLLSNAVKFTPPSGSISLNAREKLAYDGKSLIEVQVSDTGIGIAKEQLGLLFKSFEQADSGISRKFGGTGLGLAISKSIVQMMGGNIAVESAAGKGSTFTFTILLEPDCTGSVDTVSPFKGFDVSTLRVLLLSEDSETRAYFARIMGSVKIQCTTAPSTNDCFEALTLSKQRHESFSIVFIDFDATVNAPSLGAQIKKQFGSSIVVLVSVMQWNEIKEEAQYYGITQYLSKPLFPSAIMNVINEVMGLSVRNTPKASPKKHHDFSNYHLLLADDIEINREVASYALIKTKIKISHASDGNEALTLFKKDPRAYDLILMDVNMPEMDGYEATRKIRELPHVWAREIPILAMTANAFSENIRESLESGMNDHITKPLDFEILLDKMHEYLGRNKHEYFPSESLQDIKVN